MVLAFAEDDERSYEELTPEEKAEMDESWTQAKKGLDRSFAEAKAKGCTFEGCTEPVTGIGAGNPYCHQHFWQAFLEMERSLGGPEEPVDLFE